MPATNFTPIQLYRSTTASQVPTSGNLSDGELAINTNDEKLYFKNSGGTVKLLASSAGASGDVVGPASATDNAVVRFDGTTGKLVQNSVVTIADSTGDVAGVGALTMGGNLTLSGGTANGVLYLNGSKVATSGSALTFDGTTFQYTGAANFATSSGNVGVGSASPLAKLDVNGGISPTAAPSANWGLDFAPSTSSGTYTTIANNGTYDIATGSGEVFLYDEGGNGVAQILCYYGTTSILFQNATLYSVAQGTANKVNVFYNGGTGKYRIENLTGGAKNLWLSTLRLRLNS